MSWLKDDAHSNILPKSVPDDTSHPEMSWLKESAPGRPAVQLLSSTNKYPKFSTAETFQLSIGPYVETAASLVSGSRYSLMACFSPALDAIYWIKKNGWELMQNPSKTGDVISIRLKMSKIIFLPTSGFASLIYWIRKNGRELMQDQKKTGDVSIDKEKMHRTPNLPTHCRHHGPLALDGCDVMGHDEPSNISVKSFDGLYPCSS